MKPARFLVTGGFDPLHDGHIELFKLGGVYSVGLMSDDWLQAKKDNVFMTYKSRAAICEAIHNVDSVEEIVTEQGTAHWLRGQAIKHGDWYELFFVNGGDRNSLNALPKDQTDVMYQYNITPIFLGNGKTNSSTKIVYDYIQRETK